MNDAMDDEVKITVIATGFTRENLPVIHRKGRGAEAVAQHVEPTVEPVPEPEPEPVLEMRAEPVIEVQPPALPELPSEPPAYPAFAEPDRTMAAAAGAQLDDLEVPPVLRRERRHLN